MFDCAPGSAGRKHMVYTFVAMLFYLLATYISVHAIRRIPRYHGNTFGRCSPCFQLFMFHSRW